MLALRERAAFTKLGKQMNLDIALLPSGIKQLTLTGRLDVQGVNQIDNKFAFAVTTEKALVLVDLSSVEFIASIGMRLLLMNAKALHKRGGKLVIYKPQPLVSEALVTAGIDLLIPVYNDFNAACAALLQPASAPLDAAN